MILYFSGNGNSRHVATQLARLTDDRAYSLTEDMPPEVNAGVLGLVFPVHAWGMPRIVEQFLWEIPNIIPYYIYAVCTCGDDVGRTDRLLRAQLHQCGFSLDSMWSVQMANTYVALPGFDVDTSEVVCRKHDILVGRLRDIADKVNQRVRGVLDIVPGALPGVKSHVLRPLFYKFLTSDRRFSTTDACVGCGKCAANCPMHNIRLLDGRPQWLGHCTDCLRCYHRCPAHAIRYGRWSKGKGQYHDMPLNDTPSGSSL